MALLVTVCVKSRGEWQGRCTSSLGAATWSEVSGLLGAGALLGSRGHRVWGGGGGSSDMALLVTVRVKSRGEWQGRCTSSLGAVTWSEVSGLLGTGTVLV
jgi:hypothetical protein